jgi:hypothetical protein
MMNYEHFLQRKRINDVFSGFDIEKKDVIISKNSEKKLKDFQVALVLWACKKGRCGIFADTGLGKTAMQATWAHHVSNYTNGPVLIFAPLAVSMQTIDESMSFGINVLRADSQSDIDGPGVYITNYEKRDHFDPKEFTGIVLDESSILKSMDGKTRTSLINDWQCTPYRLSCTATPSPNDFMELGNQAEFLGIMSQVEMLATFFINDTGDTGKWRLKHHAQGKFWEWMSTWCAVIRKPSDIGFNDDGYILPSLNIFEHIVESKPLEGDLFVEPAQSLTDRRRAKRETIEDRCRIAADIVNKSPESWLVWCHLNDESSILSSIINDAIEVKGSDSVSHKEYASKWFSKDHETKKVLISKPSIFGYGMNFQDTHNMIFVGMDDSFEKFYQAIRRQYRFGQKKEVNVHIIAADVEGSVKENIKRKHANHEIISEKMVMHMRELMKKHITGSRNESIEYNPEKEITMPAWVIKPIIIE